MWLFVWKSEAIEGNISRVDYMIGGLVSLMTIFFIAGCREEGKYNVLAQMALSVSPWNCKCVGKQNFEYEKDMLTTLFTRRRSKTSSYSE
jgi:hypothetical protein